MRGETDEDVADAAVVLGLDDAADALIVVVVVVDDEEEEEDGEEDDDDAVAFVGVAFALLLARSNFSSTARRSTDATQRSRFGTWLPRRDSGDARQTTRAAMAIAARFVKLLRRNEEMASENHRTIADRRCEHAFKQLRALRVEPRQTRAYRTKFVYVYVFLRFFFTNKAIWFVL